MVKRNKVITNYDTKSKMGYEGEALSHLGFVFEGAHYIFSREDHLNAPREVNDFPVPEVAYKVVKRWGSSVLVDLVQDPELLEKLSLKFHAERIPLSSNKATYRWPEDELRPKNQVGPRIYTLFYIFPSATCSTNTLGLKSISRR